MLLNSDFTQYFYEIVSRGEILDIKIKKTWKNDSTKSVIVNNIALILTAIVTKMIATAVAWHTLNSKFWKSVINI